MFSKGQAALWTQTRPQVWPEPPDEMSVSTLLELEACPRRWALASADYPGLWSGRGYPPRIHVASLVGSVVHLVLEAITTELARAGCPTIKDPMAVEIMRRLGGYTKVVHDCIDRVVERLEQNPRASRIAETLARSLRAQAPEMRTQVQVLVGRMHLPVVGARVRGVGAKQRGQLATGVHPEVSLRVKAMGWKGTADLLVLSEEACEIVDFKTGEERPHHRFQVQVYALLWNRDAELNPERRLATSLTLAYKQGNIEVEALSVSQLDDLERQLIGRREAARKAAKASLPEARPTLSNCGQCDVRQLCQEYWSAQVQQALASETTTADKSFADVEITILGRHGPSSWDAEVAVSRSIAKGRRILLRTNQMEFGAGPGDRVRILGAHVSEGEGDEIVPALVTMGTMSEAYVGS